MLVRRATVDDAEALAGIQVDSWRRAYRGLVPEAFLDAFTVESRWVRWMEKLQSRESETYVTDGGFCTIVRPARDASAPLELVALYVAPTRWREGIGTSLLDVVVPRDEDVSLWVFRDNTRARAFYEAQGFVADGAEGVDPGTGVLEIRMYRPAAPNAAFVPLLPACDEGA